MEIILLQSVDNLGFKHEIVTVKPGYGRNYLIPQGFGVIANASNRKKLEKLVQEEEAKENARVEEYRVMAEKIKGETIQIGVKSGTSGKIFGKVTSVQIANVLKEKYDIDIERKKIEIPEDPKEIGSYTAKINFHPEVSEELVLELVKE